MSRLNTRKAVIERYWPDYLGYCLRSRDSKDPVHWKEPTLDGFWLWYIKDGPMGVKHRNLYYNEERVEYV